MADIGKIEYRVRPVTRYVVTRYFESAERTTGGSQTKGEYDSAEVAYQVGYALAKAEHEHLGFEPGDERIIYPANPDLVEAARMHPSVRGVFAAPDQLGAGF